MMLRAVLPLMAFCALSVLVLTQPQWGFLLYVLAPCLLIYMTLGAYKHRHNRQYLPILALKMFICFSTIGSIAMMQGRTHQQARLAANDVAQQLHAYQQQHAHYPKQLQDAVKHLPIAMTYQWQTATPQLTYASTFMPKTEFAYDFKTQTWQRQTVKSSPL